MSEEYDRWYFEHSEILDSEIRAVAALHPKGFGIDIGVGSGIFASKLRFQCGIDPALSPLKKAVSRGIACLRTVAEALPFRGCAFDFASMIVTLCFLQNPDTALDEVHRVLRDKGALIVCIVPRDSKWGSCYLKKTREGHPFYSYARFYTIAELETLLKQHGFRIVEYASTLSYGPNEVPRIEDPSSNCSERGFVCTKAEKIL